MPKEIKFGLANNTIMKLKVKKGIKVFRALIFVNHDGSQESVAIPNEVEFVEVEQ